MGVPHPGHLYQLFWGAIVALPHMLLYAPSLCSQQGNVARRSQEALLSLVTEKPFSHISEAFGSHTFQSLLPEPPPSLRPPYFGPRASSPISSPSLEGTSLPLKASHSSVQLSPQPTEPPGGTFY